MKTQPVLGFDVDDGTGRCIERVLDHIATGASSKWLACLNPHSYAVALRDDAFRAALQDADWLVPDGIGIVLASRFLGAGERHRLTGPDVFEAVHRGLDARSGGRVFLLGSTPATLDIIRLRLEAEFPRLTVCGMYSPPFRPEFSDQDTRDMIAAVNRAAPDVLWVALTAPKQEKWIHANRGPLRVPFIGAVGAAFDFYAGHVKRPPPAFQRLGLDWLVRLLQQPRRLWRRSFVSAPIFVAHVLRAKTTSGRNAARLDM